MKKHILVFLLLPFYLLSQEIVSKDIDLKNRDIDIPGTLSYPKTKEKLPLAIFIQGSGNIDRNGNQAGLPVKANYIKTLADSLNAKGIGFYRYDKRTSILSNLAKLKDITLSDFVEDARTAIDHFAHDSRFGSIYLIGHSQGSLVAMLSITDAVDGYISLAGPSNSIDKVIIGQLKQQNPEFAQMAQKYFEELAQTDTIQNVHPFLMSLFAPQNQKFIADWMHYIPTEEIQKITVPLLIINGDADLQVPVSDAKNLHRANPKSSLRIIPKMNHVLKEVHTMEENQKSYSDENFPLSRALAPAIADFVKK